MWLSCEKNKQAGGEHASSDKQMGESLVSNIAMQLMFIFHGSMIVPANDSL
jgi:hypothetical protein